MDWKTFFQIASPVAVAGLIIAVLTQVVAKLNRVRDSLKDHRPSLVLNHALLQGPPYSVDVRITNSCPGAAVKTTVRIDGLPGSAVQQRLAAKQTFSAVFDVPSDAPLRSQPLETEGYLFVECDDEFDLHYVLSPPIANHTLRADGLYNFGLDLQQVWNGGRPYPG
jgi:hypothetical protein